MDDLISRQAAIRWVKTECNPYGNPSLDFESGKKVIEHLEQMPPTQPETQWIPIKWHNCTNEDREKYGFSDDINAVFENEMPDDNQEILITTSHRYVEKDICYIDEGFSLDSGYDWIDDVKAWKPMPAPYREDGEKKRKQGKEKL